MAFNDDVSNGLVRHNINLLRFDAQLRRQIRGQLRVLQEQITARLGNYDFSNPTRIARLEALQRQVDEMIKATYKQVNKTMLGEMSQLAASEHSFGAQQLNKLIGVDIVSAGLDPMRLRALAKDAPIFGAPANEWWGRQSATLRRKFADQMRQGYLLGESTQDLVRRVRGTSTGARQLVEINGKVRSVHVFSGGIMETTTREAETLVRTSVQSIANDIRFQTYMENTDVIESVMAQVTLDGRTSEICIARGARPDEWILPDMVPVEGSNSWDGPPPWHYNCRSSLVPITKSWQDLQKQGNAEGATRKQQAIARKLDNNAPKRMRASMDGQVPFGLGYNEWLRRQPKSVQLEALGPTRQKLWQQGKLNLAQTIDQSGRPLTLRQMKLMDDKIIGGADAYIPPPTNIATIAAGDIAGLSVGAEYMLGGQAYKVIAKLKEEVHVVHWSTRTGKFVTARNKTVIPVKPVAPPPPPPTKVPYAKTFGEYDPKDVSVARGPDFSAEGIYIVKIRGQDPKRIFRNPDDGWWYLEGGPSGRPQLLGFNGKEAMRDLLDNFPPIRVKPPTPPPIPPGTTTGTTLPKAKLVLPQDYRTLAKGDVFKDEAGDIWKVINTARSRMRVVPYSAKSGRFLANRNGKTIAYQAKATTVGTFKQVTQGKGSAYDMLKGLEDWDWKKFGTGEMTSAVRNILNGAWLTMSQSGLNPAFAKFLTTGYRRPRLFNMTRRITRGRNKGKTKRVGAWGELARGVDGYYYSAPRALGIRDDFGTIKRGRDVAIHEMGHHIEYQAFLHRDMTIRALRDKGRALSAAAELELKELDKLYLAMKAEFRQASAAVGKKAGLRLKGGMMSESQWRKKDSWMWRNVTNDEAITPYSLFNSKEWFAEANMKYFDAHGRRQLRRRFPETYAFFERLYSIERLWQEWAI